MYERTLRGAKSALACFLILVLLSTCGTARKSAEEAFAADEVTTYILVRHAEKDYGDDPVLIEKGQQRAERLKEVLKNTDLDVIYSTDTRRTRQTAAPTAEDHGLKVKLYDMAMVRDFANMLKYNHRGKTILVVGHSNTTPALANILTDTEELPRFSELDYTNMLIVTRPRIGKARTLKLRYY